MGKVNAMKENYQKILDETIAGLEERGEVPKLLLHSCCAPCSSYVLEYLSNYFYITVLYYNPNIYPEDEYYHRAAEQKRLLKNFQRNMRSPLWKETLNRSVFMKQ